MGWEIKERMNKLRLDGGFGEDEDSGSISALEHSGTMHLAQQFMEKTSEANLNQKQLIPAQEYTRGEGYTRSLNSQSYIVGTIRDGEDILKDNVTLKQVLSLVTDLVDKERSTHKQGKKDKALHVHVSANHKLEAFIRSSGNQKWPAPWKSVTHKMKEHNGLDTMNKNCACSRADNTDQVQRDASCFKCYSCQPCQTDDGSLCSLHERNAIFVNVGVTGSLKFKRVYRLFDKKLRKNHEHIAVVMRTHDVTDQTEVGAHVWLYDIDGCIIGVGIICACGGCNTSRNPPCLHVPVQSILELNLNNEKEAIVLGVLMSQIVSPETRYNRQWVEMTRATEVWHDKSDGFTHAVGKGMCLDGSGTEIDTKIDIEDHHGYIFLLLFIMFCKKSNGRKVWTVDEFMDLVPATTIKYFEDWKFEKQRKGRERKKERAKEKGKEERK